MEQWRTQWRSSTALRNQTTWERHDQGRRRTIKGRNGNDHILGGAGADKIDGGNGIDTTSYEDSNAGVIVHLGLHIGVGGSAQGDTFTSIENAAGFGHDIIGDFVAGEDHLQIDHAILDNFASVQGHMQQIGNDVVITVDPDNSITLWNVQIAGLHASDFVFA